MSVVLMRARPLGYDALYATTERLTQRSHGSHSSPRAYHPMAV